MFTNEVSLDDKQLIIYGKKEIMELFGCESDKALRILKFMCQVNDAMKIGREYYATEAQLRRFLNDFEGKFVPV